jgi:hypothetical protein
VGFTNHVRLSHETIYRSPFRQARRVLKKERRILRSRHARIGGATTSLGLLWSQIP